ncbi:hypothetical protein DAEQUDRAFT_770797 [Daedalea quercina L-15889]|uniref:Uncharacterized protein n=1 Tax=Daedalea quercina L-15889 TaxID=1314783 RepID=A0A165KJN3_9APHY|nr:hypothetical protein DAEQUDRAFT_770797 [Daedalea quercina L-15889]
MDLSCRSTPTIQSSGASDEKAALCERREQAAREKKFEEWLGAVPARAGAAELHSLSPEEKCALNAIFDVEKWEQDNTPCQRSDPLPCKLPCTTTPAEALTEVVQTGVKRKREESSDEDCTPRKPAYQVPTPTLGHRVREMRVSQDVWAHICTVHGLNGPGLIRQEPAPVPIVCGWYGCTHSSITVEMHEHWKQEHEAEVRPGLCDRW